jgi:hypothetical protein
MDDTIEGRLKGEILGILAKAEKPLSTQDISAVLDRPWHSIQTRCLMLQIEGKVNGFRIGRMNLWEIKREGKLR